jgi:hypothetical protein
MTDPKIIDAEHEIKRGLRDGEDLVARCDDLNEALTFLCKQIDGPFQEYKTNIKMTLNTIRQDRMAFTHESHEITTAMIDFAKALSSDEMQNALKILRELIDIGERLRALKDSGLVDTLIDIALMLKDFEKSM